MCIIAARPCRPRLSLFFLESGLGSASEVVQAVRDAIAMVPSAAEVVWLFSDRRVDDVAPLVGRELPGETTVLNSGEGSA